MEDTLFYLFSGGILFFSLMVVTLKNLLHAALSLIASFGITAGLYILLQAEFVAVAQVMVYIGGIVIFIVFAILLVTKLGEKHLPTHTFIKIFSIVVACTVFITLAWFFQGTSLPTDTATAAGSGQGSLDSVGLRLMNIGVDGFIIPFEIISLLLLTSVIAAITVARKSTAGAPADSNSEVKS